MSKRIAIAGAGLVGSLMALYLCRRGYAVTVFERRGDPREKSNHAGRSINLALSARGLKALDEVGLAPSVAPIAIPMHGRMMHNLRGQLTFQPYGKEGQYINSVSRSDLNLKLIEAAAKEGAEFRFEQRIIHADTEATELTFTRGSAYSPVVTGKAVSEKFDIILGSDGAFSSVRQSMQFSDRFNYSQEYIEHGYKELHIPAGAGGAFRLEKNALHIWPRESFMMIALPNPDGSFTCTLFFPFEGVESFSHLQSPDEVTSFFSRNFPDALSLMPDLQHDFAANPVSSLVTTRCFPWRKNNTLLIGDAAHAIVPFYGQGMNAGFEDCRILNQLLDEHKDHWPDTAEAFQTLRKPDADAIARLALDNFIEMRDLVADADFLLRKKIEARIHALHPEKWIPLYTMVTFRPDIRYSDAYAVGQKQKAIMDKVMQRPDLEKSWEQLDFTSITAGLD